MRAVVMRGNRLVVDEIDEPTPGPGQALVETLACGICGSDLHFLQHAGKMGAMADGEGSNYDPGRDLVMGHEFCARVIAVGAGVTEVAEGDVVVSMPVVVTEDGPAAIGYSHEYGGGFAERMLLMAALCLKVPAGLDPTHAALTEPMAVGRHAVNLSGIASGESAIVHGCGPIGLAIVSALSRSGIEPIIACDYSAARRELARRLGAHEAVDPKRESAIDAWRRLAGADGEGSVVIYEAVGVPGMIDQVMREAPRSGRILVAGACMEPDTIAPIVGIRKELTIQFALGYTPEEFSETLDRIAAGEIDAASLVTARVGLDGVAGAFEALGNPDEQVKVIVTPNRAVGPRPRLRRAGLTPYL